MLTITIDDKSDSDWNKRILESPYGTIYHTNEFANFLQHLDRQTKFIKFFNAKGEIVSQLLGTTYSNTSQENKKSWIKNKILGLEKKYFKWTFGPIFFNSDFIEDTCKTFSNYILKENFIPYGSSHPLSARCFTKSKTSLKFQEWGTFLIDLSQEKTKIWNKLEKHSARKNVERSIKKGIVIKEMNEDMLIHYHTIRKETNPVSLELLKKRWKVMKDVGWTGFLAFNKNIPIGGIMISYFNNYVNEWGIARTKKDTLEKTYAQDLLKWKIIEWGIAKKLRLYDLTGVNPQSTDNKEKGIFRYKKKWGGEFIKYDQIMP